MYPSQRLVQLKDALIDIREDEAWCMLSVQARQCESIGQPGKNASCACIMHLSGQHPSWTNGKFFPRNPDGLLAEPQFAVHELMALLEVCSACVTHTASFYAQACQLNTALADVLT